MNGINYWSIIDGRVVLLALITLVAIRLARKS